jgi:hypothetical protein
MLIPTNELIEEIRCLRNNLSPFLNQKAIKVLEQTEERLKGDVSTSPETFKFKKPQQGYRKPTKAALKNKFLQGVGK